MNSAQGIILYAKHWFEETDLIEDLKKLWEIDYDYCDDKDVIQLSMIMLEKILKEDMKNDYPRLFLDFINDCQPANQWKFQRADSQAKYCNKGEYWHNVLSKFLSMICISDKSKLETIFGKLGEPDYNVLPRNKSVTDEGFERIFKNDEK